MEAGTVTLATEEKQPESATKDSAGKEASQDGSKTKDGKPVPERKRARNLSEDKRFRLFSAARPTVPCRKIGEHIGVKVGETKLQRFADGEVFFQLLENVRGVDVFVVQPTCYPVDQHLVELLVMIDALKRASAARITVVVPYYGYARQDRKDKSARRDKRETDCRSAHHGGSQSRAVCRSACRADSGLLQYSR